MNTGRSGDVGCPYHVFPACTQLTYAQRHRNTLAQPHAWQYICLCTRKTEPQALQQLCTQPLVAQPQRTNADKIGLPRCTVKKGPQSNESYEREFPCNCTISTVLWVHRRRPQSTVRPVLPMRAKQAVTVPLQPHCAFH